MKNKVYRNVLIIGVIFLFIGISMIPITSSMKYTIEKNDEMVENFDTATTPFGRYVHKIYYFGQINNLSVQGNDYEFESNNMRKFTYWRYGIRTWGISYDHFRGDGHFGIGGFNFRGILRPNFICGVFFVRH